MRRKIILGMTLFALIFFLGGLYIILAIEDSTDDLNHLIVLHRVEILREHLLIQVKRVQADLNLHDTRYARGVDALVSHVREMDRAVQVCFDCHHTSERRRKLSDLKREVGQYKEVLSRVFTVRANAQRLQAEEDVAFKLGQTLITQVRSMVAATKCRLEQETRSGLHKIRTTKTVLFILVGLGPVLALILAVIFIRGVTRPLNLLLEATRHLRAGSLDHRIQGLHDEFGEVAASFNEMAASLKEQIRKVKHSEQMAACGELATRLAHEIKNPLAGIKVAMQVLSEESALSPEDRGLLQKVIDEVRRIERLLKSLLNFAHPPKPQPMPVDIRKILEKTLSLFRYSSDSAARIKGIRIVTDLEENLPEIMADPMQLQQVFLNLFLNAVDAMPDGGTLHIKTFHNLPAEVIQTEISDTGRGFPADLTDKLFEPFFTTKAKGTGLGLTITRQLVEQHGGTVEVSTNQEGGAVFTIRLPVKSVEEGASQ